MAGSLLLSYVVHHSKGTWLREICGGEFYKEKARKCLCTVTILKYQCSFSFLGYESNDDTTEQTDLTCQLYTLFAFFWHLLSFIMK